MASFRSYLLGLSMAATLASSGWSKDVLKVRADSWMPFNGEPNSENAGYVIDLLNEIFRPADVEVDYALQPWTETLAAVKAGTVDAAIGANRVEAKDLTVPHETVGEPRMGLFVLKDIEWRYDNIPSLRQVKLGVIDGYSYWESLDQYIHDADPKRLHMLKGETPLADGIKLLDTGKIDVLAETFPVFVWAVKNSGRSVSDYRVAFKQSGEPIYVAFSPDEKGRAFAKVFDEGMKQLRTSGRLDTILKRYGLTDWQE